MLKENDLFLKKETQPQTVSEYLLKEIWMHDYWKEDKI